MAKGYIYVDVERCKGCRLCVESCPMKALAMSKKLNTRGTHFVVMAAPDICTGCGSCGVVCPDVAIEVHRGEATQE